MGNVLYDKVSQRRTIIKALVITMLTFVILVSVASAAQLAGILNSGDYDISKLNKVLENYIIIQDKAIEINLHKFNGLESIKDLLYIDLNKSDEAIKAFDKAIEINPQNSKAWNNKGLLLSNLNKSDEAIKAFDKAIEINPQDSWLGQ
jgi:tetratricopeptide (TPR) repeat protein